MERFFTLCFVLLTPFYFFSCKTTSEITPVPERFIAVAIDPSGTTAGKGWPMSDSLYYQCLIDSLMICGGWLYVYNLGRPVPNPVKLRLRRKRDNNDVWRIDYEETSKMNDSVDEQNIQSVRQFWADLNAGLFQYHPPESDDYTYLLPAIQSLCHTLNSAAFQTLRQDVLVYTDFIHHEKGHEAFRLDAFDLEPLTQTPARVFFSTYADTTGYRDLHVEWLGSPDEFLQAAYQSK